MKIDILKCHGTGNDFVLVDEIEKNIQLSEEERRAFAISVCDRKGSIGADGILFVQSSLSCDGKMRIFNADGTEPEMCGNGLRCAGRYVIEKLGKDIVTMETMKAKYTVKKAEQLFDGVKTVEIEINTVNFDVDSLPLLHHEKNLIFGKIEEFTSNQTFSAVSITNPHLISIVDKVDEDSLVEIGVKANSSPNIFPKGVNVSFVKLLDEESIYVKTYERGVGLTKSCGTGMISSSIIACLKEKKRLGSEIKVYNDGGMIKCIVDKNESGSFYVRFIGNATFVFKGTINFDKNTFHKEGLFNEEVFEEESSKYNELLEHISTNILQKL